MGTRFNRVGWGTVCGCRATKTNAKNHKRREAKGIIIGLVNHTGIAICFLLFRCGSQSVFQFSLFSHVEVAKSTEQRPCVCVCVTLLPVAIAFTFLWHRTSERGDLAMVMHSAPEMQRFLE